MSVKAFWLAAMMIIALTCCAPSGSDVDSPDAPQASLVHPADQMITIDGVAIRYRDEGAKNAPVIVMIHGFTASLETWDALSEELKPDYRIIRLDLPGHGLSAKDPASDYSNARTAAIFNRFVRELELQEPVIIGNSLGGLIAWRAASASPDLASKLVLISPGGFSINGVTDTPVEVPPMVEFYLGEAPVAAVRQASAALYGDPAKLSEDRFSQIYDMMTRPGNGEAFILRAGQFTLPPPEADLGKVAVPALIIWGEKDVMVPPEHGPQFEKVMPDARLLTYAGVGHVPQEETPKRLAGDIRKFLKLEVD